MSDPTFSSTAPMPGSPAGDDGLVRPVVAGAAAAVLGGVLWAVIVVTTKYEVGWVAWGVGALVGLAMAKATPSRGQTLGVLAALLAAAGLILGKGLIVKLGARPQLAQEIQANGEWMTQAAMHDLQVSGNWPGTIKSQLDAVAEGDTLSDALWAEMLEAADTHGNESAPAERERIAAAYADAVLADIGVLKLIRDQLGPFDLLWFGLAVTTAWGFMARHRGDAAAVAQATGDTEAGDGA